MTVIAVQKVREDPLYIEQKFDLKRADGTRDDRGTQGQLTTSSWTRGTVPFLLLSWTGHGTTEEHKGNLLPLRGQGVQYLFLCCLAAVFSLDKSINTKRLSLAFSGTLDSDLLLRCTPRLRCHNGGKEGTLCCSRLGKIKIVTLHSPASYFRS